MDWDKIAREILIFVTGSDQPSRVSGLATYLREIAPAVDGEEVRQLAMKIDDLRRANLTAGENDQDFEDQVYDIIRRHLREIAPAVDVDKLAKEIVFCQRDVYDANGVFDESDAEKVIRRHLSDAPGTLPHDVVVTIAKAQKRIEELEEHAARIAEHSARQAVALGQYGAEIVKLREALEVIQMTPGKQYEWGFSMQQTIDAMQTTASEALSDSQKGDDDER